ncbi:hypothetical protein WDU94_014773 [Cyamophila willieti]
MDFILSTSTKLLFLGSATVGVYVYWNHLYNAVKRNPTTPTSTNDEGTIISQNEGIGKLPTLSESSSSFVGSIKADFSPIYVILLNVQNQSSAQENKNYVKRVTMESSRKLSSRDPVFLEQWLETKEYYVVKVEKDIDLKRLSEIAKIRDVQRVLMRDEDTKTFVALGLGPAKAIDVKIVLYENFFKNILSTTNLVQ